MTKQTQVTEYPDRAILAARFCAEAERAMEGRDIYWEAREALAAYLDTLRPWLHHRPYPGDFQSMKSHGFQILNPGRKLRFMAPALFYPYFRAWLRREGYRPEDVEGSGWWVGASDVIRSKTSE